MSACLSRGARSDVPEMLPPTVPLKLSIPRATPYSVMDVPSTGISSYFAAAWRAGVALAIIRSTFLFTKVSTIVLQTWGSPLAFSERNVTLSPSSALRASIKP